MASPASAGATAPQLLCAVAPEAEVLPAVRDQVCAALARLLRSDIAAQPASPAGLVVTLHLTQADGRRLAGWIEWADHRPAAPRATGRSQPAAAMLPDRPADAALPESMLTRFLTLSLRDARVPD